MLALRFDLFTTSIKLAGGEIPQDRPIDGVDFRAALTGTARSRRGFSFTTGTMNFVRCAREPTRHISSPVELYGEGGARTAHNRPLLFNLNEDPVERSDIAAQRPEILADLQK